MGKCLTAVSVSPTPPRSDRCQQYFILVERLECLCFPPTYFAAVVWVDIRQHQKCRTTGRTLANESSVPSNVFFCFLFFTWLNGSFLCQSRPVGLLLGDVQNVSSTILRSEKDAGVEAALFAAWCRSKTTLGTCSDFRNTMTRDSFLGSSGNNWARKAILS